MKALGVNKNPLFFSGIPINNINKVKILGNEESYVEENFDGSFLVDEMTGTKIYYGQAAKRYLETTSKFENNTQIIAQSMTKLKVVCDEGEYILDEPGAIMINKGTQANVKVLDGSPLVVVYSKKPFWYRDLKPDNEHWNCFTYLAKRNHEIYFCDEGRKISSYQNPGEVKEEDFASCPSWVFSKLYNYNLIVDNERHTTNWGGFWDNNNFQRDLYDQVGIYGDVKDKILDVWHKTTKSGYDLSGLVKAFKGISIYAHKDKFNQNNNEPTEWITNSTAWTSTTPFMVGVSRVINLDSDKTRDFSLVRPAEKVHLHQQVNDPSHNLKEIYIPTQGSAILLTLRNGEPIYNELKTGEVAVIPPGVQHGIVAINGEYEHLCTQTPCAFQYGFGFKNVLRSFSDVERREALSKFSKKDELSMTSDQSTVKKRSLFDRIFGGLKW